MKCKHKNLELLGLEKGREGTNKYYKCLDCGTIFILSENKILYEISVNEKMHVYRD